MRKVLFIHLVACSIALTCLPMLCLGQVVGYTSSIETTTTEEPIYIFLRGEKFTYRQLLSKGKYERAFRFEDVALEKVYTLNDGTIMVNNAGEITSLHLTPIQMQALDSGSVDGYIVITPSNVFIAIPRDVIIKASPELQALQEAKRQAEEAHKISKEEV